MPGKNNGNPFPGKWTLAYAITKGTPGSNDSGIEPHDSEEAARTAFAAYRRSLPYGYSVTAARIIPPDGDGDVIVLVGPPLRRN